jgi:S-adenosylmethionine:tRNA ribosyltransferase-isomerase
MLVSDFDFELPQELIAQQPPIDRAGARMLSLDRETGALHDGRFLDFPELLQAGDVLVLNDSRVIPARLFAQRQPRDGSGGQEPTGQIEVLLTEQQSEWEWKALVRPGRKVLLGERLQFSSAGEQTETLQAEVITHGEFGERTLRFVPVSDFFSRLETLGHMPLPPYIHREDETADRERYQTIYARERGSVAAPTAGLHFTGEVLDRIRARGVQIVYVTLHVGLGTFQPIRVERFEDIRLHSERYTLPPDTATAINRAKAEGRRVIAAGTTTVRALEHCALQSSSALKPNEMLSDNLNLEPHSGSTSIFISPGFNFRVVTGLLTNFHLPQSSLLMLVSAFGGHGRVMAAYRHAVAAQYRFFSYGDCMFLS